MKLLKPLFITPLALALLAPAIAQAASDPVASAINFCVTIRREINSKGLTAAPGSPAAAVIAGYAGQSASQYRAIWNLSKVIGGSNCERMY